jgi:hypothetical protein
MNTFEPGKTYWTTSICDHNCVIEVKIISRTQKTVRAIVSGKPAKTFRPGNYDGAECLLPWGRGSMMPIVDATDTTRPLKDWEHSHAIFSAGAL